jgi:lipopolysaccharide export system protein LptA
VRLTIERIRTLVLATGVLLVAAIAIFLAVGKWKNPLNRRDIPGRLGIDIQQEANGVTYTQSHGGRTIFKIHASRVVQLRNDRATLHDVVIELYGQNGSGTDRIVGDEFEYDQKTGTATAAGPVEITLMPPPQKPAEQETGGRSKPPAQTSQENRPESAIHVKTSGLVFNQKSGVASTDQRVEFTTAQGSGSATGASYDSDRSYLVLNRDVELTTQRGPNPVQIRAQHAEFDRDAQICYMQQAAAQTRTERATAVEAQVVFRDDGSVERVDAAKGFTVSTDTGSRVAAPTGVMEFNDGNQPRRGNLTGGVTMDSAKDGRTVHGVSPEMELQFDAKGELHHAHLERGVEFESHDEGPVTVNGQFIPTEAERTWRSPVADVDFRNVGQGQVEPAALHGTGGVVLTGQTRRGNAPPESSRLAADDVSGQFGPNSTLSSMAGVGHAAIEQTTATGARQTANGDRLDVRFVPTSHTGSNANAAAQPEGAQIESAVLDGHVTLHQQPAAKAGAQQAAQVLTATAGHAVYESTGEWLHLTVNPRVDDGGMELTANRIDVSQASGDAFAHGNVKATWMGAAADQQNAATSEARNVAGGDIAPGGHGPAHVIAAEAQLHQPTGEATFRGHARLWQGENSVAAPVVVIDRQKQTLVAQTTTSSDPVVAVVVSAGGPDFTSGAESKPVGDHQPAHSPSVIRVRGGDLWYSGIERKAIMRAAPLTNVTAATGTVQSASNELDLFLSPAANASATAAPGQIDRMTAIGDVVLLSQGRRGTGEQLVYSSRTGDYVLTGSPLAPPRMTDPQRGAVTGQALIFHTRDDSVSIEGGNQQTMTQTTAPR